MTSPQALLVTNGPSLFDLGMAAMELIHFSAVRRRRFLPIAYTAGSSQLVFTLTSGEKGAPEFMVRCSDVFGVRRQCGGFDGLLLELAFDAHEGLPWDFAAKTLYSFYDASSQCGFVCSHSMRRCAGQYYVDQDKSIGFKPVTGGPGILIYDAREREWKQPEIPC